MRNKFEVALSEDREAVVTYDRGNSVGFPVSSILFDADANVIGETDTTVYNGYCIHEVTASEVGKMLAEPDADIEGILSFCECEMD